jgi:flagellar hook-associated protein 1 FlgK
MSLGQAISSALSGLQIAQTGVSIVAGNISNAETPGYVRKALIQSSSASLAGANGARVVGVRRELDIFVQRQLRAEFAGAAYSRMTANYYNGIQNIYGTPGSLNALDHLYNNFAASLQALNTSPESNVTRNQVMNEAAVLVQHLNSMSSDIQTLRSQAEVSLRNEVGRINQVLKEIENLSTRIAGATEQSGEIAALLDARDVLIGELSGFMDIRISELEQGQISIYTTSGISLYDHTASQLRFDGMDAVDAHSMWSADPEQRMVGTIRLTNPGGYSVDLIQNGSIRSGSIKAHLEMRDEVLVQAQAQIDNIAHSLATALSNRPINGSAANVGAQSGFTVDLAELKNGNSVSLRYIDAQGQQQNITIVRVDDAAALPLSNDHTADPTDTVIGVSFANGMTGVLNALTNALGSTGLVFDTTGGSILRVLNDGGANPAQVQSLSATVTVGTFNSGHPQLPFFIDGGNNQLYTNAVSSLGQQKLGFAARIKINPQLKADASLLVQYGPGVAAGDPTRPSFIEQALTATPMTFDPATGIGSANGPYSGSITDFIRQTVSFQGANTENAKRLNEGQEIVVNALQSRYAERSTVNVDSEMANLLVLQQAYGANARVLSTVKDMIELLMRI